MKVVFDHEFAADGSILAMHYIDLSAVPGTMVMNAAQSAVPVRPIDFIAWLQANPGKIVGTGWELVSSMKGVAAGTKRWNVLVAACNAASASAELKALNLTVI